MLKVSIRGRLQQYTAIVDKASADAVATVIRRRTTALKNAIRKEILAAGLGERLANAVRSQVWPERGGSLGAHGRVWSKAIYKRAGGLVDLFTTFEDGAAIQGSPYLAIAAPGLRSPKDHRRMARPSDFPADMFDIRPTLRAGQFLLVFKAKRVEVVKGGTHQQRVVSRRLAGLGTQEERVAFLLIRTANVRKRLNIKRHHARIEAGIDAAIAAEFDRLLVNEGRKAA